METYIKKTEINNKILLQFEKAYLQEKYKIIEEIKNILKEKYNININELSSSK